MSDTLYLAISSFQTADGGQERRKTFMCSEWVEAQAFFRRLKGQPEIYWCSLSLIDSTKESCSTPGGPFPSDQDQVVLEKADFTLGRNFSHG